ncbi:MAG TPA: hypothetical protein PKB09_02760 [Candidatus Saccharibacteria bacterium]|nr:hypothetical protein [Candidatus Saccharibacteria bacterium]
MSTEKLSDDILTDDSAINIPNLNAWRWRVQRVLNLRDEAKQPDIDQFLERGRNATLSHIFDRASLTRRGIKESVDNLRVPDTFPLVKDTKDDAGRNITSVRLNLPATFMGLLTSNANLQADLLTRPYGSNPHSSSQTLEDLESVLAMTQSGSLFEIPAFSDEVTTQVEQDVRPKLVWPPSFNGLIEATAQADEIQTRKQVSAYLDEIRALPLGMIGDQLALHGLYSATLEDL